MRGAPLIQALILLVLLAAVGLPVWSLTQERPRAAKPVTAAPRPAERSIRLEITTNSPAAVEIRLAGKVVASSSEPARKQKYHFSIPDGAADLVVAARWQDTGSPNAIRLNALLDGDSLAVATFWGDAEVEDVLTIPAAP